MLVLAGICGAYQQIHTLRLGRRLLEAEKLFYLIGDTGSDLIAIVDTRGRRLYNSPSYEKILGYSPDDLKDTSGLDQIHPEDRARVIAAAEDAKRTGSGHRLEYRIRHRDGSWRIFESTCSAVRDHRGKIDKLIIVNRDITAQREQAREIPSIPKVKETCSMGERCPMVASFSTKAVWSFASIFSFSSSTFAGL